MNKIELISKHSFDIFSHFLNQTFTFSLNITFSCLLKSSHVFSKTFQAILSLIKSLSSPSQVLSSHYKVSLKRLKSFSKVFLVYIKPFQIFFKSNQVPLKSYQVIILYQNYSVFAKIDILYREALKAILALKNFHNNQNNCKIFLKNF